MMRSSVASASRVAPLGDVRGVVEARRGLEDRPRGGLVADDLGELADQRRDVLVDDAAGVASSTT